MTLARVLAHPDIRRLRDSLRDRPARATSPEGIGQWAAVAVIARCNPDDAIELLFIRRVEHVTDRWSGQIAFPGGREDSTDGSLERTATRETWEEVGLDLAACAQLLGALDDVAPRTPVLPPIAVRPFVFAVPSEVTLIAGAEVADTFWIPMEMLLDPTRRTSAEIVAHDTRLNVDAMVYGERLIWGMTFRIVQELGERLSSL